MSQSKELSFLIHAVLNKQAEIEWKGLDGEALLQLAKWHAVVPLTYSYIEQNSGLNIPDAIVQEFRAVSMEQAVSNMVFLRSTASLYERLQERGIRVFPMKGVVWSWLLYDNPAQRQFGDIDFYVDPQQISEALKVFEESGFVPDQYRQSLLKTPELRELYLSTDYQLPLVPVKAGHLKSVELQWNGSYPRYRYSLNWSELMSHPISLNAQGSNLEVPAWEAQLLMMIIHHAGIEQWDKLKYFGDFIRLLRKYSEVLDWQYVAGETKKMGFYKLLLQSLGLIWKVTGEDYFTHLGEQRERYPSAKFYDDIMKHWDETRDQPVTKSTQILQYNLKYRDRLSDKIKIVTSHIHYLTRLPLILKKARWYSRL